MAYTNVFLTGIASDVATQLAAMLKTNTGLIKSATKRIVPAGQKSVDVWIPGAVTDTTRAAGSILPTAQTPTDTKVTFTPATEYHANPIALDRITGAEAIVNVAQAHAPLAATSILSSVNAAMWALVNTTDITGGNVGSDETAADISLLAQARKVIVHDNECSAQDTLYAIIGGEEEMAWTPQMTYGTRGLPGVDAQSTGRVPSAYGFQVVADPQRATSGNTAYNLCMHPLACGVAFRSDIAQRPGVDFGQYTDPDTGITIFTELIAMSETTYGVGTKLSIFCVADVKLIYPKWACIVKSVVA